MHRHWRCGHTRGAAFTSRHWIELSSWIDWIVQINSGWAAYIIVIYLWVHELYIVLYIGQTVYNHNIYLFEVTLQYHIYYILTQLICNQLDRRNRIIDLGGDAQTPSRHWVELSSWTDWVVELNWLSRWIELIKPSNWIWVELRIYNLKKLI